MYDSKLNDRFVVHKPDCDIHFSKSKNGLYYHDTTNRELVLHTQEEHKQGNDVETSGNETQTNELEDSSNVITVEEIKERFPKREQQDTLRAREIYGMIGYPSYQDFLNSVQYGLIDNCTITVQDIKNAQEIYGPDVFALKGKTKQTAPEQVRTVTFDIPEDILNRHKSITLSADVMYVNGVMFFVTISQHIKFTTIQHINERS
jgi:hypothetical protein